MDGSRREGLGSGRQVISESYDELVFVEPAEGFWRRVVDSGGNIPPAPPLSVLPNLPVRCHAHTAAGAPGVHLQAVVIPGPSHPGWSLSMQGAACWQEHDAERPEGSKMLPDLTAKHVIRLFQAARQWPTRGLCQVCMCTERRACLLCRPGTHKRT